jgi:hypothetical protein
MLQAKNAREAALRLPGNVRDCDRQRTSAQGSQSRLLMHRSYNSLAMFRTGNVLNLPGSAPCLARKTLAMLRQSKKSLPWVAKPFAYASLVQFTRDVSDRERPQLARERSLIARKTLATATDKERLPRVAKIAPCIARKTLAMLRRKDRSLIIAQMFYSTRGLWKSSANSAKF